MKKMKRLVAILLASVLALAMLTACGEAAVVLRVLHSRLKRHICRI